MTCEQLRASMALKSSPPPVAWLPEILAASWATALKLVVKLDGEKRIIHDALPWVADAVCREREEAQAKGEDDAMEEDDKKVEVWTGLGCGAGAG